MTDEKPILLIDDEKKTEKEKQTTKSAPTTPAAKRDKLEEMKRREEEKERLRLQKLEELKRKEDEKERLRIQREEEKRKKEEEREKLKREKEEELKRLKREKEEELKRKEEEKERLRLQREEEKRKKDEEKEKLRLEKIEKERKRLEAVNAKLEEKKRKEEEKERLEAEKRETEEKKKQQFFSYFIKKDTVTNESSQNSVILDDEKLNSRFLPFQVKKNMYLPPIHRRLNFHEEKQELMRNLDELMEKNSSDKNYLTELKNGLHVPRTYPNTIELNNYDSECIAIDTPINKYKVKLLLFDPKEYRRPPYYGTWRKKSKFVKPRKPFSKDTQVFNYDIDSDEEWEDEPDGESIASSKCDDDEEIQTDDADEEDDGFFVPHGHLSDDEIDEENRILEPTRKEELERVKREEYEKQTSKKFSAKYLVPKIFGCIWDDSNEELNRYKMVPLFPLPISLEKEKIEKIDVEEGSCKVNKQHKQLSTDNENSPSGTKSKSKSKAPAASPVQKPTNTPSIMQFISRNKKETTLVQISTTNDDDIKQLPAPSPVHQKQQQPKVTPSVLKFVSKNKKDVQIIGVPLNDNNTLNDIQLVMPPQQQQQPPQPTTPSLPEKRVYSDNEQSCVKRLKLDTNDTTQSDMQVNLNNKENEDSEMACIVLE